jgi:hypothetical protein
MFCITKNSFAHVYDWIDDVRKQNSDDPLKYVLGNKCDLEGKSVGQQDQEVGIIIIRYLQRKLD